MIRPCKSCGTQNRIPAKHLAHSGKCGSCHEKIPPVDAPLDVDTDEFDEITQNSAVPVLVDFWAAWCGPCRAAAPHVKETAKNKAGRAVVLKVDTDANPELAQRYGVRGIPNFLVMKAGRVVMNQSGLVDHRQMESWIDRAG